MWILLSDLHLSDRPKDGYRFGIFPWLRKQQEKYSPEATFVLGDLTQDKDNHSSTLVNRTVDELMLLRPPVYICRGNHDGISPNNPFFRFLNQIEGIYFIIEPEVVFGKVVMIPHCRTEEQFKASCESIQFRPDALMLHQTIAGAIAETGRPLNGFSASPITALKPARCYAGDVHKPQQCGPVQYIGAPYQIRFGDAFEGRVLLVNGAKEQNLYYPYPHKWTLRIRDAGEISQNTKLKHGDQVKLIIELAREEATEWSAHKRKALDVCKELGLEVFGTEVDVKNLSRKNEKEVKKQGKTKDEVFTDFCKNEKVSSHIKQTGIELLKG